MTDISSNNKRIAKNTMLLYVRMLFLLIINLYTSRIVLQKLGVIDFGIYDVVGGIIAMLGFMNSSLSAASSRFITYDIGAGNMEDLKSTFGNILSIHFIMAVFILVIGETIGLWFLRTQLQIPVDRQFAAFWVFQFSILTSIINIISVPYNALIIGHERMSAFAYISIVEATLKLFAVFMLAVSDFDKLILYSLLLFLVQVVVRFVYGFYSNKHFEEAHTKLRYDKKRFKEIFSFAGWTMNGNLAVIGYTQGLNVLLNMFFGPAVNAARGLAVQVQNACSQFCSNFQMALNPQLTKSYAKGDLEDMHKLLKLSSKFSFFILLFIAMPIMFEAEFVLKIWLKDVPEHTANFLRLVLVPGLLYTLANPIIMSVHATGKLKKFQIVEGSLLLMIVPIAYFFLKLFDIEPEWVFVVHIVVELFTQYARLRIVLPMIKMDLSDYIKGVIYPVLIVSVLTSVIPYFVDGYIRTEWGNFIMVCVACTISNIFIMYLLGCSKGEKQFFRGKLMNVFARRFI